MRINHNIYMNC